MSAAGFVPTNELEWALLRALQDPASRPRFHRVLLAAELLILGRTAPAPNGERTFRVLETTRRGHPRIPVFSAVSRIRGFQAEPASFLKVRARTLFAGGPADARYVVNPGSAACVEIGPALLRALLSAGAAGTRR